MTWKFDQNDSSQSYMFDVFGEIATGTAATLAGDTPLGSAIRSYELVSQIHDAENKITTVENDPNLTDTMKAALSVLFLLDAGRGNPFVTEMPVTVAEAWHLVNDVPDVYGGGTTAQFWAMLGEKFPSDFQLDGTGHLIEPTFISTPPSTPDWSMPLEPFVPGALPTQMQYGVQPAVAGAVSTSSPLVIDLSASHTGVTLTSWNAATTTTYFDLNDTGFAVQTAWVSGSTGLLARDLNSNGIIDSSAELFGSPTIDGFAKLAALDSNHDLRIDANDSAWSSLVVWTDSNGDAITESGELHSLASLGIASIDLAGVASSTSTIDGNPISHTSKVTFTSGATAAIDDAWFVHDNTNSYDTGSYSLDTDTLFLPTLRGYGTLPDLTVAMSQDSDLKSLVSDFVSGFSMSSFADAASLKSAITDILYEWAGVTGVDPNGRGEYVDGQHLAFLEHLVGADFFQVSFQTPNPYAVAGSDLEIAFQKAFDMFAGELMLQAGANTLFANPVAYDLSSGTVTGDLSLSHTAITALESIAPSAGPDNNAFWEEIGRFLDGTKGLSNITVTEAGWLDTAVNATDPTLHWSDVTHIIGQDTPGNSMTGTVGNDILNGGSYNDTIYGNGGSDVIHGNDGDDTINASGGPNTLYGDGGNDTISAASGNDTIYGGDGNDTIYADAGNNTIYGGAGGNILHAAGGNDTYVYGGGNDLIVDSGGTDQIDLPSGITSGDLSFSWVSSENSTSNFNDLLIDIAGAGSIQIQDFFYSTSDRVESIVFSDSSVLDLTTLARPDIHLTSGNDSFVSTSSADYAVYGGDGDDYINPQGTGTHTMDGGAGNDQLIGYSGNDTYIASPGFDTITEGGGTDTIVIPAAYTESDVTFYRINNGSGPTNDLGISINGLGEIDVQNHFSSSYYAVENLHFLSDNSTLSLTDMSVTTVGTAGNDNLTAPSSDAGPNDIMDGREGNDNLSAGDGDDTYIFSAGHDIVNDTGGNDTIHVREIYSPSDVSIAFVEYNSGDKALQLTDSDGNTILVNNDTNSSSNSIEHVSFGDGTV